MISRVLIANRGEIAVRILRACRSMGIEAVVAHSEADRDSRAVMMADEAICIGPPESSRSYLSAAAVISAALVSGCDAIHPGYGFLSEDDTFAEMTRAHDLVFIGPARRGPGALRLQGWHAPAAGPSRPARGARARRACCATTSTPSRRPSASATRCSSSPPRAVAARACAWCARARELQQALTVCRSEARAAFGDDSLYLEKWLEQTRHVEVQVIIDDDGNGVHVGERDCSVQRRHQKIVEEAPSPAIDEATRAELASRPSRAAVAAGYRNVGTLEFLVDGEGALLLHRDQRAHPGGAPSHGDALRHRHRGRADPSRCRRAAGLRPGRRAPARPRHRVPHQRGGRARRLPAPGGHRRAATCRRVAQASAWRRTSTAAMRCRRTTIRSSASSSSGVPTGRAPSPVRGWPSRSCSSRGWRRTSRSTAPSSRIPRSSRAASIPTCSIAAARQPSSTRPPAAAAGSGHSERETMTDVPPPLPDQAPDEPAPGVLLSTAELQRLIPHRWPFLLVDRVLEEDRERGLHPRREGRHRHRVVLRRPLPRAARHARRPPGGGPGPDDGHLRGAQRGLRRSHRPLRRHRRVPLQARSSNPATASPWR